MKPLCAFVSAWALLVLVFLGVTQSAPGLELSHVAAVAVIGGADCGDTYEWKSLACADEVYRHNNRDVNCNSVSYETYSSTGTGTRKPGYTTNRQCRVCGSLCNSSSTIQSHVPKKCTSSP